MFIYKPKGSFRSQELIKSSVEIFGVMPPHWELFAKLNPTRFEMFLKEIEYLLSHPNINPDFFAMVRLFVANKEGFEYCKKFNTKLLLAKGFSKHDLKSIKEDFQIPLDQKHQILADGVKKALYAPKNFTNDNIDLLKKEGWSDSDIFDAIDHGAFLFKFSKILKAYLI